MEIAAAVRPFGFALALTSVLLRCMSGLRILKGGLPAKKELGQLLNRNALFFTAALPLKILPPFFNRYGGGTNSYGAHVDQAIRYHPDGVQRVRTAQVTVDGATASGLFRMGNNLWLHLGRGRHQVDGGAMGAQHPRVGERGVTLSGGQKQRIAIARTLMKDNDILIFDDSLSAVDTKTDAQIRETLLSEENKVTTFIISHRVSTLSRADMILVLEDGRITASGTHEELISAPGLYARINAIQTGLEDSTAAPENEVR